MNKSHFNSYTEYYADCQWRADQLFADAGGRGK